MVGKAFSTRLGSPYKAACSRIPKRIISLWPCNFVATWRNFIAEKKWLVANNVCYMHCKKFKAH